MAEVAGAYAAERIVEGAGAAAYGVARSTLPLKGYWQRFGADTALPRSSHSLVSVAGKVYVFGGEVEARTPVASDVHVFTLPSAVGEPTDYTTVPAGDAAPPPRVGHTAVAVGQWMYVFGGRGGKEMKPLDEAGRVWCFDTKTSSWSALDPADPEAPRPDARSYHAGAATSHPLPAGGMASTAVERHGTVFVHGGCPASGRLADLWAFDVAARTWRQLPDAPGPARGGAALACADNTLYRFGGFDGTAEVGGQIDVLDLGKDAGAAALAANLEWTSVKVPEEEQQAQQQEQLKQELASSSGGSGAAAAASSSSSSSSPPVPSTFPGNRSVSGLHHVTTGQGRRYLVLVLGERSPSGSGHEAAGSFWDDVWAFQLRPEGASSAGIKDAIRSTVGMSTRRHEWAEVLVPEATMSQGRRAMPGPRGWFASSTAPDIDGAALLLWGGIDEKNQRLADGYVLTIEAA